MLVSCMIYIVIFAIVSFLVQKANIPPFDQQKPVIIMPPYENPPYGVSADIKPVIQAPAIPPTVPTYPPPVVPPVSLVTTNVQLTCPICRTRFPISAANH